MSEKITYLVLLLLFLLPSCSSNGSKQAGVGEEPIFKKKEIEHDKKKASEQYEGTVFNR